MNSRTALAILVLVATLVDGCGKPDRIVGKVQDVFGKPVKDAIVRIEKTAYSANTDGSGDYSVDYAPGSLRLIVAKAGYTTIGMDLSIGQKVNFAAETITLYPIPNEEGIFFVDTESRQLTKVEPTGVVHEEQLAGEGFLSLTRNYRYRVLTDLTPTVVMKPGKRMFIDTSREPMGAVEIISDNGLIFEGRFNAFERHDKRSGLRKDSMAKVGAEGLRVRTLEVEPSRSYAWIRMIKTEMIGTIPDGKGVAFGFRVE